MYLKYFANKQKQVSDPKSIQPTKLNSSLGTENFRIQDIFSNFDFKNGNKISSLLNDNEKCEEMQKIWSIKFDYNKMQSQNNQNLLQQTNNPDEWPKKMCSYKTLKEEDKSELYDDKMITPQPSYETNYAIQRDPDFSKDQELPKQPQQQQEQQLPFGFFPQQYIQPINQPFQFIYPQQMQFANNNINNTWINNYQQNFQINLNNPLCMPFQNQFMQQPFYSQMVNMNQFKNPSLSGFKQWYAPQNNQFQPPIIPTKSNSDFLNKESSINNKQLSNFSNQQELINFNTNVLQNKCEEGNSQSVKQNLAELIQKIDLIIRDKFICHDISLEEFELNPKNRLENKKYKYMEKIKVEDAKNKEQRSVLIKNCARYIFRNIIKQIKIYQKEFLAICNFLQISFSEFSVYFLSNINNFKNIDQIRENWIIDSSNEEQNKRNLIMRCFSKYFLSQKINRYILIGRMKNKNYYLKTVRQMLKHIDNPESYRSNFF